MKSYIPDIEFAQPDEIRNHQSEKLKVLIRYVAQQSPYYRRLFQQHEIDPKTIVSLDDLSKIPPTTKTDLQKANWDFLSIDRSKIAEYTSTSGTLGKPVTIALSENDLKRLGYNEAISFACADLSDRDVFQLMLTLDRQFMAGIAYYQGVRSLGAGVIRVGPALPAVQWDSILRLKPTVLVGVPSFVTRLITYAREHRIDINQSTVQRIVCIGENIRDHELRPNLLAAKITEAWNVRLYGTYASTEMQTAFPECHAGAGGHLHPELMIVETLDENNNPVPAGEPGEVTITTLGVEGMPLVRYRTGDMARLYHEPCRCGRTTTRIGPVLGRKQQMLKLKGTTVYPPAIFEVLNGAPHVQDYAVEAITNSLGNDEVRVYLLADPGDPGPHMETRSYLQKQFQSILRVTPELIFTDSPTLDEMHRRGASRKITRFVDTRTNNQSSASRPGTPP